MSLLFFNDKVEFALTQEVDCDFRTLEYTTKHKRLPALKKERETERERDEASHEHVDVVALWFCPLPPLMLVKKERRRRERERPPRGREGERNRKNFLPIFAKKGRKRGWNTKNRLSLFLLSRRRCLDRI